MSTESLFQPLKLGRFTLGHRVVMAPLTRMRATPGTNAPNALNAKYYGQRASDGGLIVCEATPVIASGTAAPNVPGVWSDEQIAGWKLVTDAIHAKGGIAFLQLWHGGRISHSSLQPDGGVPQSASDVPPSSGMVLGADFKPHPFETPRPLRSDEIPALVAAYGQAAENAVAAGFDGIEIHGANGYLLEQFLQSRTNKRTDAYGGSIENRARLMLEATKAAADAIGADRVGIRLSPYGQANDSGEDDPMPLYSYVIGELNKLGLAYLHLIEPRASGAGQREVDHKDAPSGCEIVRPLWKGTLITAGNFKSDTAAATVAKGHADAIAFGRYFIANPDLPELIRHEAAFRPYDRSTFYGGDARGYTDYEPLSATAAAE